MPLSKDEREQFLTEPHIAALSVPMGDGTPMTVPMWYQYSPGGEPWVWTGTASMKARLIQASGCFSLMVDRAVPTARYVAVAGPVSKIEPATDDHLYEMARRYIAPHRVEQYAEYSRRHLGEHIAIYMSPERWLSSELGDWLAT